MYEKAGGIVRGVGQLLLIAVVFFAGYLLQRDYVEAMTPGYNGKISYHSAESEGNFEIYTMNADGSGKRNITNHPSSDKDATWSPDGTRIAFASDRDGDQEVYVMNADGSNVTQLTFNTGVNDTHQQWSPDGSKIAFISMRDGNWEIYVMNADGSDPVNISNNPSSDQSPSWSPDGSEIVFTSTREGKAQIYKMNADGSDVVRLTNNSSVDGGASWHPAGNRIIFQSFRDENYEVYSMNVDGSDQQNLTNSELDEYFTSFSPDGKQIIYRSEIEIDGDYGIAAMNVDGSNRRHLTSGPSDSYPQWQPVPNKAPIVGADVVEVAFNTVKTIDVLINDSDEEVLENENLSMVVQPKNGSAERKNGIIMYTPRHGYVGDDRFSYQICDSFILDQKCGTGEVHIVVKAASKLPVPIITQVGVVSMSGGSTVYYTGHRPTFSGTTEPFAEIRIEIHSDPIILTTAADSEGNWSATPDQDIPNGEHTVTITSSKDGATSDPISFSLGINTGLANTGFPLWPLSLIGLAGVGYVGYRRYVANR